MALLARIQINEQKVIIFVVSVECVFAKWKLNIGCLPVAADEQWRASNSQRASSDTSIEEVSVYLFSKYSYIYIKFR